MFLLNKLLKSFCVIFSFVVVFCANMPNAIAAEVVLKLSYGTAPVFSGIPGNPIVAYHKLSRHKLARSPRGAAVSHGFLTPAAGVPGSFTVYTTGEINDLHKTINANTKSNATNLKSLSNNFTSFTKSQQLLHTSIEDRLDGLLNLINSSSPSLKDADKEIIRQLIVNELERRRAEQQDQLVETISRRVVGLMDQRLGALEAKLNNLSSKQPD